MSPIQRKQILTKALEASADPEAFVAYQGKKVEVLKAPQKGKRVGNFTLLKVLSKMEGDGLVANKPNQVRQLLGKIQVEAKPKGVAGKIVQFFSRFSHLFQGMGFKTTSQIAEKMLKNYPEGSSKPKPLVSSRVDEASPRLKTDSHPLLAALNFFKGAYQKEGALKPSDLSQILKSETYSKVKITEDDTDRKVFDACKDLETEVAFTYDADNLRNGTSYQKLLKSPDLLPGDCFYFEKEGRLLAGYKGGDEEFTLLSIDESGEVKLFAKVKLIEAEKHIQEAFEGVEVSHNPLNLVEVKSKETPNLNEDHLVKAKPKKTPSANGDKWVMATTNQYQSGNVSACLLCALEFVRFMEDKQEVVPGDLDGIMKGVDYKEDEHLDVVGALEQMEKPRPEEDFGAIIGIRQDTNDFRQTFENYLKDIPDRRGFVLIGQGIAIGGKKLDNNTFLFFDSHGAAGTFDELKENLAYCRKCSYGEGVDYLVKRYPSAVPQLPQITIFTK